MTAKPSPADLWRQAGGESGEYLRLLREHGLLVPRESGDTSPLFACGYVPAEHRAARRRTDDEQAALGGREAARG